MPTLQKRKLRLREARGLVRWPVPALEASAGSVASLPPILVVLLGPSPGHSLLGTGTRGSSFEEQSCELSLDTSAFSPWGSGYPRGHRPEAWILHF